jgi:hypothetical protein
VGVKWSIVWLALLGVTTREWHHDAWRARDAGGTRGRLAEACGRAGEGRRTTRSDTGVHPPTHHQLTAGGAEPCHFLGVFGGKGGVKWKGDMCRGCNSLQSGVLCAN